MKKRWLAILLFVLFALPIPIALLGAFMTFFWFISALLGERTALETVLALIGILMGSTYVLSYVFSVSVTNSKKKISFKTFLPLMHCAVALVYLMSLSPAWEYIRNTHEYFGFTMRDFEVIEEIDTHGGFHGDGSYFLVLDCSGNKEKAMENLDDWNELPLPEDLNYLMYGVDSDGYTSGYNLAEDWEIPRIENGYYKFLDRNMDRSDSSDTSEFLNRGLYNYTIAVYDSDTNRMYYLAEDT